MVDRKILLQSLKEEVVEIYFLPASGEKNFRGTLFDKLLPVTYKQNPEEAQQQVKFHEDNPDLIACWDVVKGGWRSFNVNDIQYVQGITESY